MKKERLLKVISNKYLIPKVAKSFDMKIIKAFDFDDTINEKIEFYEKYKIQVPFIRWNNKTFFRISSQVYNSIEDFEYLIRSLKDFKK